MKQQTLISYGLAIVASVVERTAEAVNSLEQERATELVKVRPFRCVFKIRQGREGKRWGFLPRHRQKRQKKQIPSVTGVIPQSKAE